MKRIMLTCFLVVVLSFSSILVFDSKFGDENTFNICDDGLIFVRLDISPEFESDAQKDFYVNQYKREIMECT